ncbi:MAG: four helix bundle protein [Acidobacteria bacterium]|nr:four helix bundle protein [Acidobacteriota bacterium]MBI3426796.1 four helix bundle protein [Acidobacteriota bacterium]
MARDFMKIKAWQLADDLVVAVYGTTKTFPREELFGLTSQLRRAAYSVPANIAEGANRSSKKDYLHFLSIAAGSLAETRYFLHLSNRLGYLADANYQQFCAQAEETSKTLSGLVAAIQKELVIQATKLILLLLGLAASLFTLFRAVGLRSEV